MTEIFMSRKEVVEKYGSEGTKRELEKYNHISCKAYLDNLHKTLDQHYHSWERVGRGKTAGYMLGAKRDEIAERERKGRQFQAEFYKNNVNVVYIGTNLITGEIYIGSTITQLAQRILSHKNTSSRKNSSHYDIPLYKAIREYGWDNFKWEIIQEWEDEETLHLVEDLWILNTKSYKEGKGYNRKLNTINGFVHHNIKLSNEDIKFIRENYTPHCNVFGAIPLAEKFGVTSGYIRDLTYGRGRENT